MAATTEKRSGLPIFAGPLGRNIFYSDHQRCLGPLSQLSRSPPSSNDSDSSSDLPSPIDGEEEDPIITEAYALAKDYIQYKAYGSSSELNTEASKTLRRMGDELVDRHQTVVHAVSKRLAYSDPAMKKQYAGLTLRQRMFVIIADEMGKDKKDNWGRVVSLFVVGGILALNNMEQEGGKDINNIISFVGNYVGTHKRSWIESNGGWDGFVKFFNSPSSSQERKVWKGLLYASLGLGAIVAVTRQ